MNCAREGHSVASSRHSIHHKAPSPSPSPPPAAAVDSDIVSALLNGQVDHDTTTQIISLLASHFNSCSAHERGRAELAATLQATEVLVEKEKVVVLHESGALFWLISVMEDLAKMEEGETLQSAVSVLNRATSLLLVSLTKQGRC